MAATNLPSSAQCWQRHIIAQPRQLLFSWHATTQSSCCASPGGPGAAPPADPGAARGSATKNKERSRHSHVPRTGMGLSGGPPRAQRAPRRAARQRGQQSQAKRSGVRELVHAAAGLCVCATAAQMQRAGAAHQAVHIVIVRHGVVLAVLDGALHTGDVCGGQADVHAQQSSFCGVLRGAPRGRAPRQRLEQDQNAQVRRASQRTRSAPSMAVRAAAGPSQAHGSRCPARG